MEFSQLQAEGTFELNSTITYHVEVAARKISRRDGGVDFRVLVVVPAMDDEATGNARVELSVSDLTGVEEESLASRVPCGEKKKDDVAFSIEEWLQISLIRICVN